MLSGLCEKLEWDSRFFNLKIGRIKKIEINQETFESIMAWAREYSLDCLYFLSKRKHRLFEIQPPDYTLYYVGDRVLLERELNASSETIRNSAAVSIRPVQEPDIPFLEKVAQDAFGSTRFCTDPHFPESDCRRLYATWTQKSCRGMADTVFVALQQQIPVGFITCYLNDSGAGQIGLLAVDQPFRHLGIGRALLLESVNYFKHRGVHRLQVITQAGIRSGLPVYLKMGFVKKNVNYWYHIWRSDAPRRY
jgi:dTDP-4-amino-4,6-dideoxy-D-galactose acyltransferase